MSRVALVIAFAGCYRPVSEAPCTVRCDDTACPASLECGGDRICRVPGTNDCTIDASTPLFPDAPPDVVILDTAPPNIAQMVQLRSDHQNGTTSMTSTLQATPTVGDVLVMIGANSGSVLDSVSGGGVNTWTRANRATNCPNVEIWYGVVTDTTSKTVTISCSYTGDAWMSTSEWSGVDAVNTLDQASANGTNSGSATPGPGSITTSSPRELVMLGIASQVANIGTPMPGTWHALPPIVAMDASGYVQAEWYMLTTTTGMFSPTIPPKISCWDAVIASFRVP